MVTASYRIPYRSVLNRTLLLFVPMSTIALVVAGYIFYTEVDIDLAKTRSAEAATVRFGSRTVEQMMQGVLRDITYLAEHNGLAELTSGGGPTAYNHLLDDWLVFSRSKGVYDQIRWIDLAGHEQARVNFNAGSPRTVPIVDLQDKHGRYYFQETIPLPRGRVYISPLDLNIENGKIERPLKPMIRIGTPVFDRAGNRRGVVILNYLGNILIQEFNRVMESGTSRASLINREGFWLKGPSADVEWGFMFGRTDVSMAHTYPDVWKRIADTERGQFSDEHGLWTFDTVHPLAIGETAQDTKGDVFTSGPKSHQYYWKNVLLLPRADYIASIRQTGLNLAAATTLLLLGLFFISWRLARTWARKTEAEARLHQLNEKLESRIAERTKKLRAEVAERKKTEEVLRRSNEDLQQFAHVASHDLREPLRTVTSYLQLLNRKYDDALDDEAHQFLDFAVNGAKRMDVLVKDLLQYSSVRPQGDATEAVTSKDVLNEVLSNFRDDLSECNGTITVSELPDVTANRAELQRLFQNLIGNALKYRSPDRRLGIHIGGHVEGDHCTYHIQDNGIGIEPQYFDRIFVIFQRLHRLDEYNGTGIGLALCKKIVERNGGRIWVESEPGNGSTFFFRLPAATPALAPSVTTTLDRRPADDAPSRQAPGTKARERLKMPFGQIVRTWLTH